MTSDEIIALSKRLLRPYVFPKDSPYLSEDQRALSEMTVPQRIEWMAEWLHLADAARREATAEHPTSNVQHPISK